MNSERRTSLAWWFIFLLVVAMVVDQVAEAGGDRVDQAVDLAVTGPSISGDSSRAYALGMGDVDINDYYRSHQALFLQWTTPNLLALATYYDSTGRYEAAAILKCSLKAVRKALGARCKELSTVDPSFFAPPAGGPTGAQDDDEDDDAYHAGIERELEELRQELKKARAQPRPAPVPTELANRLDDFERRRVAARAALEGSK